MPERRLLTEPQARAQARAWLAQQHTDAHELLCESLGAVLGDRCQASASGIAA